MPELWHKHKTFTTQQHNLDHVTPKLENWFWLTSGVTNIKQQYGSEQPHMLEVCDAKRKKRKQ
jgi:hypothetical protein